MLSLRIVFIIFILYEIRNTRYQIRNYGKDMYNLQKSFWNARKAQIASW